MLRSVRHLGGPAQGESMTRSGIGALFVVAANDAKMTGPVCDQMAGMVRCVLTLLPGSALSAMHLIPNV